MHFVEAKGILSARNGMNVYRGCSHGCIYCDARSKCYNFTHRFEDIEVKINAPELLESRLKGKRNKCMIGTGAMCDPYMHCEEELKITKRCLEIIDKYGFGVAIQTKSDRILRDIDILDSINKKSKAVVQITLTTYDDELSKIIEPNVCCTSDRFKVLKEMQKRNIPTVVWLTPILPFINDTEENIKGILNYCVDAGVKGIIIWNMGVTLREGDREYFYDALDKNFPGLKRKYHMKYGNSYEVISDNNEQLMKIFYDTCKNNGIISKPDDVFNYMREFPENNTYEQMTLWDV